MSLESWKNQFYPVSAAEVAATKDDLKMLDHAILKWTGRLPHNVAKHNLRIDGYRLRDDRMPVYAMEFGIDTCSLCVSYFYIANGNCIHCPLFKLYDAPCYETTIPECEPIDVYKASLEDDPTPMLSLLNEARVKLLRGRQPALLVQHKETSIEHSTPDETDTHFVSASLPDVEDTFGSDTTSFWSSTVRDLMLAGF